MRYWVVWWTGSRWTRFADAREELQSKLRYTPTLRFSMGHAFPVEESAVKAIIDVMLESEDAEWARFGVQDDAGNIVWAEDSDDYKEIRGNWKEDGYTIDEVYDEFPGEHFAEHVSSKNVPHAYKARMTLTVQLPQEEDMSDTTITAPLNVPRDALIDRLKSRKAEEIAKREAAAAAGAARRQALLDAVAQLSTDQVANLLDRYVLSGNPEGLAKQVAEWVEEKKYVSKDAAPTSTETTLDKLISVLEIAADKTIEVKPTDPVYPLL